MNSEHQELSQFERHVGRLLVTGVTVSAIALLAGLALYLISPGSAVSHVLLVTGLFVLMATPMLRVVVSVGEYVRMKDWFFMATTMIVLGVLAISVLLAFRG